jgi:hypothetical protein
MSRAMLVLAALLDLSLLPFAPQIWRLYSRRMRPRHWRPHLWYWASPAGSWSVPGHARSPLDQAAPVSGPTTNAMTTATGKAA